jgi:SelR domain
VGENRRHSRRLGWGAPVSGRQFPVFRSVWGGFRASVSGGGFSISVSAVQRPVSFMGALWTQHAGGLYRCICCDTVSFDSSTKFESSTGWISNGKAIQLQDSPVHDDESATNGSKRALEFAWWLFVWIFTLARGVVRIRFAPSSDEAAMLEMRLRIRSTAGVTSSNFTGPLSAPVTCCAVVSFQPMRRAV